MLFLQPAADGSALNAPERVPVDDAAGLFLERALLASDRETRLVEVSRALAADKNLTNWAIWLAEGRLCRAVNRVEEAASWLADNLVLELGTTLKAESTEPSPGTVEW